MGFSSAQYKLPVFLYSSLVINQNVFYWKVVLMMNGKGGSQALKYQDPPLDMAMEKVHGQQFCCPKFFSDSSPITFWLWASKEFQ